MRGIYQHCAEKHLHRYLAEYDFRFNHRVAFVPQPSRVPRESVSRIVSLIAPTFRLEAERFLRWRRKRKRESR